MEALKEGSNLPDLNSIRRSFNQNTKLPLTKREIEVLKQLGLGKTNKEISEYLVLSESTIRNHISSIFIKLKITNRSQATAISIYSGVITLQDILAQETSKSE